MNIYQADKSKASEIASTRPSIAGICGGGEKNIDNAICDAAKLMSSMGIRLVGVSQERGRQTSDGACREIKLKNLGTGQINVISERRGKGASGCHLDRSALIESAEQMQNDILRMPDIVLINRFGRAECEGSGFRQAIELAVNLNIPVIAGVRRTYQKEWVEFHGGYADVLSSNAASIVRWFKSLNI